MPYSLFAKPYRTPAHLIQDLKAKNLSFRNEAAAEKLLSQISYYHFKIYLHPLIDKLSVNQKHYRNNEFFETGVELYRFDEELRSVMFKVIAKIEVKLRSRLDHTISAMSANPFWYLDNIWFFTPNNNATNIDGIRDRIGSDFNREGEMYARNYRSKYYNETHDKYKSLPPFWIASELISLGQVFRIYNAIDYSYVNNLPAPNNTALNDLASEFGASNYKVLVNWIKCMRDVRNRCAHHSRLWNAKLAAPTGINSLLLHMPTQANRPYGTIVAIQKMMSTLQITNISLRTELQDIFARYPQSVAHMGEAGFPVNWDSDPFWI